MTTDILQPTPRTKVRRAPQRGTYESEQIYSILDEGVVCHVAFVVDGQPFVIPTAYARLGDRLILHGSVASRMMRELSKGIEICVSVTLVDGLVLARSAFHHSMNYRSVVVFGRAKKITDTADRDRALDALVEHLVPERLPDLRPSTPKELQATEVLELPITEASAKIRTGAPIDPPVDLDLDVWAGVIPLETTPAEPVSAPDLRPGIEVPDYARTYRP